MKKLGLFIAVFSMMLFTSCEKEEENTDSNVSLKEKIIGTWEAERMQNFWGMEFKDMGTMTFNEDGTGLEKFDQSEAPDGWEIVEEGDDEESPFTWSMNSDDELTIDFDGDEVTMSNIVNEADSLEFSGTMSNMDTEDETEDETEGDDEIVIDFGFEDMTIEVGLKLTR